MTVDFKDNSMEILAAFQETAVRALEKCGLAAEGCDPHEARIW